MSSRHKNNRSKLSKLSVALYGVFALAGILAAAGASAQDQLAQTNSSDGQNAEATQTGADTGNGLSVARKPAWTINPSVTLEELYSDNINLAADNLARSDLVTQITPGIAINGNTKRLNLHLDYQVTRFQYLNSSQYDRTQNAMNGFGTLELLDKWLYVDGNATIGQVNTSPFAPSPGAGNAVNQNTAETRNFALSPYIKGRLFGAADYELRYRYTKTSANNTSLNNVASHDTSGRIASSFANTRFGWSLGYTNTRDSFSNGPESSDTNVTGVLTYQADPQLNFGVGEVHDRNNYSGTQTSNGLLLEMGWRPSPITALSAHWQNQRYGSTYDFSVSHRSPLSEVVYHLGRSVNARPTTLGYAGLGSLYDLLYSQLASSFPDPNARATEVQNILNQYGLAPNTPVIVGYLQNQVTLDRQQSISFIKRGVRNVVTVTYQHSFSSSLQDSSLLIGNVTNTVKQDGFNMNWSHLLSATSNLSANYAYLHSKGDSASGLASTQKTIGVNFAETLGKRSALTAGISRITFESTNPYTEDLITLTFNYHY